MVGIFKQKVQDLQDIQEEGMESSFMRLSIREYLMSELCIFRNSNYKALAIIDSDTFAHREWNEESCAVVLRMSPSWIRIELLIFARTKMQKKI